MALIFCVSETKSTICALNIGKIHSKFSCKNFQKCEKNRIFEKIEFGFDSSIEEHVKEPETPTNNRSAKIYRRQLKKMSYIVFQNLTHFGSFWCKIIENQWFPAAVNNLGRGRGTARLTGGRDTANRLGVTFYDLRNRFRRFWERFCWVNNNFCSRRKLTNVIPTVMVMIFHWFSLVLETFLTWKSMIFG